MANGNPFHIDLSGGDYSQELAGLGQTLYQVGERKRQDAQKAKAEERYKKVLGSAEKALSSGDARKVASFAISNPEFSQSMRIASGILREDQRDTMSPYYRQALSDPENAISYLERGIKEIDQEQYPNVVMQMSRDRLMLKSDPEAGVKNMELGFASIDPENWEIYNEQKLKEQQFPVDEFQFGAQSTFKDENDDLFFGTTRRNKGTGEVESVLAPLDGGEGKPVGKIQQAGNYGLTAEQKVAQIAKEKTSSDRAKSNEQARQSYIKSGTEARSMIVNTKRLLKLNELIRTGRIAQAQKGFGDLFGVTNPDLGEFNARAGQMVLGNIRQLGANPTEGERAFLLEVTPSLRQGGKVNDALLRDLLKIQERQVNRAKWFVKNPQSTVEEYLLATDEGDFEASEADISAVSTQEEYDAMPSGTVYLENGVQYRKP